MLKGHLQMPTRANTLVPVLVPVAGVTIWKSSVISGYKFRGPLLNWVAFFAFGLPGLDMAKDPGAPEKNQGGHEKGLANLWSRKKITKRPTLVVGKQSNGKYQLTQKDTSGLNRAS